MNWNRLHIKRAEHVGSNANATAVISVRFVWIISVKLLLVSSVLRSMTPSINRSLAVDGTSKTLMPGSVGRTWLLLQKVETSLYVRNGRSSDLFWTSTFPLLGWPWLMSYNHVHRGPTTTPNESTKSLAGTLQTQSLNGSLLNGLGTYLPISTGTTWGREIS